jgi:uncharacterized protein (TIGR03437 family)
MTRRLIFGAYSVLAIHLTILGALAQYDPGCQFETVASLSTSGTAPRSIGVDSTGRWIFADPASSQIVAIGSNGAKTVLGGTGGAGFSGDQGPASKAQFATPLGVAVDKAGNIYVADTGNNRVRKIDGMGQVTTIAGSGSNSDPPILFGPAQPIPALEAALYRPQALALDSRGNLYILISATFGRYLFSLSATDGMLRWVYPGNSYAATLDLKLASFAVDSRDNVVVGRYLDTAPEARGDFLRIVDGVRKPIDGLMGLTGYPKAMTADEEGNLYVLESTRLRRISPSLAINTLAGFAQGSSVPAQYYSGDLNFSSALLAGGGKLFELNGTIGLRSMTLGKCQLPPQPAIAVSGIVNATGMVVNPGRVSPGEVITVYGTSLGPSDGVGSDFAGGVAGNQVGNTRVLVNGVPSPMLYAQGGQVNAIVPFSASGNTACISVEWNGISSDVNCQFLADAVPGLFLVQNQDGAVNSSSNPASRGTIVTAWGTGFGVYSPALLDGQIVSSAGGLALPVRVTVGGALADVKYAGPAPGLVAGIVQLNIALPGVAREAPTQATLGMAVGRAELQTVIWVK